MFTKVFVIRTLEQMLIGFILAFGAVATATDGGFTKAAILGAVAAGVRAVYGVLAANVNDPQTPQVK